MRPILAIDPGPVKSAYVTYYPDRHEVGEHGILDNDDLIDRFKFATIINPVLAIEKIASYGMSVGEEIFETCRWSGRIWQVWLDVSNEDPLWITRIKVKSCICHDSRAKDKNIRQALIDMFPGTGGGKIPQVGTKKQPGPLFGVKDDIWAALAVAITASTLIKEGKMLNGQS